MTKCGHVTLAILVLLAGACGQRAPGGDDDDDSGIDLGDDDDDDTGAGFSCPDDPQLEICNDGLDQDCDEVVDCDDPDCDGTQACENTNCGQLDAPGDELALPDGACPEDESQSCDGFENSIDFQGFSDGQTLTDVTKLLGICVNMEHSWMRDLVVYAECPNGTRVMLSDFQGHTGGEVYLGEPDDSDDVDPNPGVGYDYCWTPTATNEPWIPYANAHGDHTLPAGDYQSSEPLDAFEGCPLNGNWTIRVEDRWGIDNGFIFSWLVRFDRSLVEDCSNWPE